MDIYLVRHGEAAQGWGQSRDPGLSELGLQQAQAAAQSLHSILAEDVQLLSSPLARARETAAPLAGMLDKPVQINGVFQEIPAPVPLAQRQQWLRGFMQQRWEQQPDSLHQWRQSAVRALLELQQPAVVFTHFLVLNAVVGHILSVGETVHFRPDNGSITHLRYGDGALEVVTLGQQMQTVIN
jgi:broad specificity phosphatase PhoE